MNNNKLNKNLNKNNIIIQINNNNKIQNIEKFVSNKKNNLIINVKNLIKYHNVYIDIYTKLIKYNNTLNDIIKNFSDIIEKKNSKNFDIILKDNKLDINLHNETFISIRKQDIENTDINKFNNLYQNIDEENIFEILNDNNNIINDQEKNIEIKIIDKLKNILNDIININNLNNEINNIYIYLEKIFININTSHINIIKLIEYTKNNNNEIYNKLSSLYNKINNNNHKFKLFYDLINIK